MVAYKNIPPLLIPCYYSTLALSCRTVVLVNIVRNPHYMLDCPTLQGQIGGFMTNVAQLQPLVR
eukprot:10991541-Prorocentrum_lima.AAC.1